jgi:RNA polymerase sigma-70 factor (ECF subfamily)
MALDPHQTIPTRQSLIERLKDWQDQKSWLDFFNTYWKLIYGVARRMGLTDAEAQDVVQETLVAVAKKMGGFKTDPAFGSFKSWLLLITRRRIHDQFRKRQRALFIQEASDATPRTPVLERLPDPGARPLEQVWQAEWEANVLEIALEKVKQSVSSKQFLIYYQHVFKQWPARKVSEQYGVTLAQVYMAKYRISTVFKREIKKLEKQMF